MEGWGHEMAAESMFFPKHCFSFSKTVTSYSELRIMQERHAQIWCINKTWAITQTYSDSQILWTSDRGADLY